MFLQSENCPSSLICCIGSRFFSWFFSNRNFFSGYKSGSKFIYWIFICMIIKNMIYVIKKKNYDISSRGEITSKKSSSFLRGPRVPIMLIILTFRTIFVHNLFSPCSTKRRVSDKDLPVIPTKLFDFISNNCVSETSKVNTSSIHTLCLRVLWVEDPA